MKKKKLPSKAGTLGRPHLSEYDEDCPICTHTKCSIIEDRYKAWDKPGAIAEDFNLQLGDLLAHVRKLGLSEEKAKNQRHFYRVAMEKGMEYIEEGLASPDTIARIGLDAAKHIDRLEGRIIDKHQIEAQKTLTIVAPPLPGGIIEAIPEKPAQLSSESGIIEATFEENQKKVGEN